MVPEPARPALPMARLHPQDLDAAAARDPSCPELATLRLLAATLSDAFTVYHGVHWAKAGEQGASYYGEIDFIVVDRLGRALAIEQKNGPVRVAQGDLVKDYASGPKSIRAQVARNIGHLMREFGLRHAGRTLALDHLVYLPDHDIAGTLPVAVDASRIVDAREAQWLGDKVLALFDARGGANADTAPDPWSVHAFFSERIDVAPHIGALHVQAGEAFARLSGGLATWVSRLSLSPFRLRVTGAAGSGKTQLALQELRAAYIAGESALYVCFNRALADAMRRLAPDSCDCTTFHELGARAMRARGEPIDWSSPGVYERLSQAFFEHAPGHRGTLDLLVVDEGQDFEAAWAQALLPLARESGRALWLEDRSQNLYRREPVPLPGWAGIDSPVCFRSPRLIVAMIDALGLADAPMLAGSAIHGFDPELACYPDGGSALAQTEAAVRRLVALGHDPAHIAVVSLRGRAQSEVVHQDMLGGVATCRFTGRYDDEGAAICTDGPLVVDTVFRFKGRTADCVVLTEVDFTAWTDDLRRRLFVAMTRARLRVDIVATERAGRAIEARMA